MQANLARITGLAAAAALIFTAAFTATPAAATPAHAGQARAAAQLDVAPAYFAMTDVSNRIFIVKITSATEIAHARALLSDETQDQPHIIGQIVKTRVPYNPRWSYHLDPGSIQFFDFATEVCDATIPYVQDHLDEAGGAFLPGLTWCPWSSRLVRELHWP